MKKFIQRKAFLVLAMTLIISYVIPTLVLAADTNEVNKVNHQSIVQFVEQEIDKLSKEMGGTGLVASVVTSDEVLLSKGYGYADVENEIKSTPDTTGYRIGSVSKTFTTLAVMQLVEAGKIDLDRPITDYIGSDFYEFKYPITIRHLLTHSAGFEEQNIGLFVEQNESRDDLRELLRKNMPEQVYEPDVFIAYSNYGLALAGYIMELVTGIPFIEYTQEHIFDPLEMTASTFDPENYRANIISKGYDKDGNERSEGKVNPISTGAVTSTADDMAKYMQYLLSDNDERILGMKYKKMLFDKQFTMTDEFDGIGFTWYRHSINGQQLYTHSGGTDNFSTNVTLFKEADVGLFISSNSHVVVELVTKSLIEYLYGSQPEVDVNKEALIEVDLKGTYQSARRSYTHNDKIMNLFLPTVEIKGSKEKGYTFRGEEFEVIDEETIFNKNLGVIKIAGKPKKPILIINEGEALLKISKNETVGWYFSIFAVYTIMLLIGLPFSLVILIKGLKKRDKITTSVSGITIALSTAYAYYFVRIYNITQDLLYAKGDTFFNLLTQFGTTIFILGLVQVVATVLCIVKKKHLLYRISYSLLSINTLIAISALAQLNLIFS